MRNQSQDSYTCDFGVADKVIAHGRVETTTSKRETFWASWCGYVDQIGVDPYLANEDFATIVRSATGFSGRVRCGYYARGRQVTGARVQVAVRAIDQTCKMEIKRNPLYHTPEQYLKPIKLIFAEFKRGDPIPVSEISVPVSVPQQYATVELHLASTPQRIQPLGVYC